MHTSGITVDEAVAGDFASAKADPSSLFLQFRISNDKFIRTSTGRRTPSRDEDFLAIHNALNPSEASFIIARPTPLTPTSPSADKWLLLFYMPDSASVRDRMIYSSSSSALRDGLGSSSFTPHTWNIRDRAHCTSAEFDELGRRGTDEDLMTSEELAAKEAETSSHLAMGGGARVSAIVGLPIKVEGGSVERLKGLKEKKGRSCLLKLNGETETLSVEEEGDWTFEEAATRLPSQEPRYLLTHFHHQHQGEAQTAYIFYYYCPDAIKPKLKMFYSTAKSIVVKLCDSEFSLPITKSLEISDRSEMTTTAVMDALHPVETVKKAFKKPARPGRGNARLIGKDAAE